METEAKRVKGNNIVAFITWHAVRVDFALANLIHSLFEKRQLSTCYMGASLVHTSVCI